jgi:endonuclease/exonuclease/phosphatase family metal-dependent hydrolase
MADIKVCSWNIEHFGRVFPKTGDNAAKAAERQARRAKVKEEVLALDPDVLCLQEGPSSFDLVTDFCQSDLNGLYQAISVPNGTTQGQKGSQKIYFLVKQALAGGACLMEIDDWRSRTSPHRQPLKEPNDSALVDADDDGSWLVRNRGGYVSYRHSHYRHPQVLRLPVDGGLIELIGVHLKSKYNRETALGDHPEVKGLKVIKADYIDTAVLARIKLATEAVDVRHFIEARFTDAETAGLPEPAIMVMGDFNDGPGKEVFERQFLFFDLLSILQGDVTFARRFLNHALFDFDEAKRWTYELDKDDPVDPGRNRKILLDHILFSQSLVNGTGPADISSGAGKVEHAVHEQVNQGILDDETKRASDHRPVSVTVTL